MAEYIMHRFDSIGQFVDAAAKGADKDAASHAADRYATEWTGTQSFEQCVEYATLGGWEPDSLLEFRDLFDGLLPRLRRFVTTDFERGIDQSGFEVNMQAFLDGEPDHMFQWVPTDDVVSRRVVTLILGHSVSSGCTAHELFVRGQAAIALVRALSLLGFELEVWSEVTVHSFSSKTDTMFTTLVRLHGAGQIMDESALEFAVGNPSWLRRLIFGFEESQPAKIRKQYGFGGVYGGGYGAVKPIQHADLVGADIQLNLGETWFKTYNKETTAKDGMEWAFTQLKKLGAVPDDATWED